MRLHSTPTPARISFKSSWLEAAVAVMATSHNSPKSRLVHPQHTKHTVLNHDKLDCFSRLLDLPHGNCVSAGSRINATALFLTRPALTRLASAASLTGQ